jgi:hypothetical protein
VQDLCSFGIDQAIEIEKVSLATVVCLNSCILDIHKYAFLLAPVPSYVFATAAQAFASCVELHINWLTLMGSHVLSHVNTAAAGPGSQAQTTSEELAHCMDIAIGERFTAQGSTVASSSGSQAPPKADVSENYMGTAIGARKRA